MSKVLGGVAKAGAKKLGKVAVKAIPFVGLGLSLWSASERLARGEIAKAALDTTSGVVGMLPGPGTAISLAIDGGLLVDDIREEINQASAEEESPLEADALQLSDDDQESEIEDEIDEENYKASVEEESSLEAGTLKFSEDDDDFEGPEQARIKALSWPVRQLYKFLFWLEACGVGTDGEGNVKVDDADSSDKLVPLLAESI